MSYSEYTWQTGETITAEKLNNLEGGVQEALAGGGSVEVSKIKLGTANGGFVPLGSAGGGNSYVYAWSGGFSLDGQTIGDLIGDKTIIDFAFDGHIGAYPHIFPFVGQVFDSFSASSIGNYLTASKQLVNAKGGGNVCGLANVSSQVGQDSSVTIDVYAICI